MKVESLHEDGEWRITRRSADRITDGRAEHVALSHRCKRSNAFGGDRIWKTMFYHVDNRGVECHLCHRKAPDGLQVAFWFIKEEQQ